MRTLITTLFLVGLSACASNSVESILAEADLAQLSLTNPQNAEGRVLTGGQPSPEDLAALKEMGFSTIISLRQPEEDTGYDQPAAVADLGMTFIRIPVGNVDNGLDATTAMNLRAAINQTSAPVLVHCGSGNRVGAIHALGARYLDGKSIDEALAVGRSTGMTRFEPTVRELLESGSGQ